MSLEKNGQYETNISSLVMKIAAFSLPLRDKNKPMSMWFYWTELKIDFCFKLGYLKPETQVPETRNQDTRHLGFVTFFGYPGVGYAKNIHIPTIVYRFNKEIHLLIIPFYRYQTCNISFILHVEFDRQINWKENQVK